MIDGLEPYRAMKDSGVPWLGEVPGHWEVLPLKRVASFKSGAGFPIGDQGVQGAAIPFFKVSDMNRRGNEKWMKSVGSTIARDTAARLGAFIFPAGSIIFPKVGGALLTNKRRLLRVPSCVDNNVMGCMVRSADVSFTFILLQWLDLGRLAKPGPVPAVGEGEVSEIRVAMPPLPEQAAIVRFLDHADRRIRRYIRAKQKLIKLLEEQKQAIIHRAVTCGLDPDVRLKPSGVEWLGDVPEHWEVRRLGDTVAALIAGTWGSEPDGVNDILCVRVADFDRQALRVKITRRTDRAVPPRERGKRVLQVGDLLLEKSGGGDAQPVGAVVLFTLAEEAVSSNFVARMPAAAGHDPGYLVYLHSALYTLRVNVRSIKQTTGIQNIAVRSYLAEPVALPPLSEQVQIARELDRLVEDVHSAEETARKEIALLREYRTRLIADVVTGKLDVREAAARLPDESDEPEAPDDSDDLTDADDATAVEPEAEEVEA